MTDNKIKPNYFAVIPAKVRYDKRLKPIERLLYAEIAALSNQNGECWATNKYFANLYEVSKETVSRWISHLVDLNYISTNLIFKSENNQIDKRIIYLIPIDVFVNRYCQNRQGGIDENVKENNTSNSNNNIEEDDFLKIFKLIESEFGRTISPLEAEMIKNWDYPFEIIKLAISEAVSRNAFSFKYIDQIIYRWQKNGIKTIEEAENQIMKFNDKKAIDNQSKIRDETIDADYGGFEVLK